MSEAFFYYYFKLRPECDYFCHFWLLAGIKCHKAAWFHSEQNAEFKCWGITPLFFSQKRCNITQFSREQRDSARWWCTVSSYLISKPVLSPLERQAAHFSSPRVHCSTCLAWMGRTAQSPGVLSCPGVSFGRSFPLSHPCSCHWVKASAEKEFRSCTANKLRHLLQTNVRFQIPLWLKWHWPLLNQETNCQWTRRSFHSYRRYTDWLSEKETVLMLSCAVAAAKVQEENLKK